VTPATEKQWKGAKEKKGRKKERDENMVSE
jgi:hypothetical protein